MNSAFVLTGWLQINQKHSYFIIISLPFNGDFNIPYGIFGEMWNRQFEQHSLDFIILSVTNERICIILPLLQEVGEKKQTNQCRENNN